MTFNGQPHGWSHRQHGIPSAGSSLHNGEISKELYQSGTITRCLIEGTRALGTIGLPLDILT